MDVFEKCFNYTDSKRAKEAGLYPYFKVLDSGQDTEVMINGKRTIMIGSNNYMGLTSDPRVKKAAAEAAQEYGSGCSGSRFLNGNMSFHQKLEERLSDFVHKEAALVFSTGYQTNLGIISAVAGRNDYIICDRLNHASIIDACRLSFAKMVKFEHNDMDDLERVLSNIDDNHGKLIVVDGVFSMEGHICKLPETVRLARKYGARIMVDDAHGLGVLGERGRGTGEHFGLEDEVDIIMGTFSKSLASLGGFMAANADVVEYVKHVSRPLIFSASIPPASAAAALKALEIIEAEPERIKKLWENAARVKEGFKKLGLNTGNTETPIIPILIGDEYKTFMVSKLLLDEGVYVNPVVPPAVHPGNSLLRTSYTATHTNEQLDYVLEAFERVFKHRIPEIIDRISFTMQEVSGTKCE